jgi:5'-3' exonuclease
MLVDLSIMCGCDFNQKLKGYGEEALLNLILQYRSLDNFPSSYDLRPLNYQRCRELFGFCPSLELIMEPGDQTDFSFDLNRQSLITSRDYLECYGLDFLLTKLSASSHQLESSSDGWPLKLNLSAIPYYPPEIRKISPQFNLIIIPDSDDDWDPR